jgi:DNA (cytosine-5)-methyltransferase 1
MTKQYTVASLFSGAGGMDIGFQQAGFEIIWANDIDQDACATHKAWSDSDIVCSDVSLLNPSNMPKTDIITGGFPCQGFSLAGPRKLDDSRNTLYKHFVQCVNHHRPLAFVAENVKGILTLGDGEIIKCICQEFTDNGYRVTYELLNAKNYLVPQDRHRVIIVGVRRDVESIFTFPMSYGVTTTLQDAIGHLPEPDASDVCHHPYSSRYMSRDRRRCWNEPSFTIPAMAKQIPLHPSSPAMVYIEKDKWKFGTGPTRRLSWIESALIQTFPAGMEFCGDLTSKYKQIGNAVPPQLAKIVAMEVLKCLI